MSELITRIAHPPSAAARTRTISTASSCALLRRRDGGRAVRLIREHIEGTEHILAGLI